MTLLLFMVHLFGRGLGAMLVGCYAGFGIRPRFLVGSDGLVEVKNDQGGDKFLTNPYSASVCAPAAWLVMRRRYAARTRS